MKCTLAEHAFPSRPPHHDPSDYALETLTQAIHSAEFLLGHQQDLLKRCGATVGLLLLDTITQTAELTVRLKSIPDAIEEDAKLEQA